MKKLLVILATLAALPVLAASVTVPVNAVSADGIGKQLGTVTAEDGKGGLVLKVELAGLPQGEHGFHLHQNPSCEAVLGDNKGPAAAAGGHFDPKELKTHLGPAGQGHLGDLPFITVDAKGEAKQTVTAPRLTVKDIQGHSFMVHAGGDNYMDEPPLGGGGARIACGVIK